jgi:preprotein translocase subunit SecE
MAVAEAKKMEKDLEKPEPSGGGLPTWLAGPLGWGPRKFNELRSFMGEVRTELKKVTWPGRQEVYATTIVVVVTTIFFGFYLYVMDLGFSWTLSHILKQ